jgi:hypothetical protein
MSMARIQLHPGLAQQADHWRGAAWSWAKNRFAIGETLHRAGWSRVPGGALRRRRQVPSRPAAVLAYRQPESRGSGQRVGGLVAGHDDSAAGSRDHVGL